MKTITIGDRQLSSITKEEFGELLYKHDFFLSKEHFHPPVFGEFEYDTSTKVIHFEFYQLRKDDNFKLNKKGHFGFSLYNHSIKFCLYNNITEKIDSHDIYFQVIADLIKMGFDIPIY